MTIRHLTVFVAVAEQGSMSAAAKHLYISQPTVSQAIRELENHYNGLLFERLGKKLYLTDRGKLLLPHAREMIRQFQQLEELMQNQGQSSTLKLGSTLTVGTVHYPGSAEKISGSGCLLFCHQHQEHRAETSPLRTGRCCGRR